MLKEASDTFSDTLAFFKRAFRHARVHFQNVRFRPSKLERPAIIRASRFSQALDISWVLREM